MRRLLLLVLALAACSSPAPPSAAPDPCAATGSPAANPAAGDHRLKIVHCGTDRTFTMHAPPSYAKGLPLVIVFHQQPGDSASAAEFSNFSPLADQKGFLVAYPEGIDRSWNVYDKGPDDSGFVSALIDHAVKTWGADPKRVYATGFSNGAQMSYQVARDLPGKFAAVAPVSGMMKPVKRWKATFGTENPVSLLAIQGGIDSDRRTWPTTNDDWRKAAGCGIEKTAMRGKLERKESTCANGGVHVVLYDPDLPHKWPDYAAQVVLEFFMIGGRPAAL